MAFEPEPTLVTRHSGEVKLPEERDATRVQMVTFLPVVFQDDPSNNLQPFLDVLNNSIEAVRKLVVGWPKLLDIDEVPEEFILDLSRLLGNDFDYFAPTDGSKRKKVKALIDLYKHKGIDYTFRFIWQQSLWWDSSFSPLLIIKPMPWISGFIPDTLLGAVSHRSIPVGSMA